jgi:ribosome maturation protein SDO1
MKEEWQSDGSFIALLKVPAGMQEEFYSFLNRMTRGEAQTKLMK